MTEYTITLDHDTYATLVCSVRELYQYGGLPEHLADRVIHRVLTEPEVIVDMVVRALEEENYSGLKKWAGE